MASAMSGENKLITSTLNEELQSLPLCDDIQRLAQFSYVPVYVPALLL
ncbi:MAG: hypothetical protein AAFY56_20885 [Pseudomonadota bacterium]